jgi:hypothetical protein
MEPFHRIWGRQIFLLGKLKIVLMATASADEDELLHGVMEALKGISRGELEAVFEELLLV